MSSDASKWCCSLPKLRNPHFNFVTLSLNDAKMAKEFKSARRQDIQKGFIVLLAIQTISLPLVIVKSFLTEQP